MLSGHLQTLYCGILSQVQKYFTDIKFHQQICELEDGGKIGIDWVYSTLVEDPLVREISDDDVILIIVPGVAGDQTDSYVLEQASEGLN